MLTVVATPIGNYKDITLNAIESLKEASVIIAEEMKPARVLLKRLDITDKEILLLNEHSKDNDAKQLINLCRDQSVALISDCGTPGFCDPGWNLVDLCYQYNIPVKVCPGPSSLMTLLSISGVNIQEFHFVGFLPAEKSQRAQKLKTLQGVEKPLIVMDTPYRLKATLNDFAAIAGDKKAVLGLDLTGPKHQVCRDKVKKLATSNWPKLPFVLIIL